MSSWMGWSAATSKPLKAGFVALTLVFSKSLIAQTATCAAQWEAFPVGSIAMNNPMIRRGIEQNKNDATLEASLKKAVAKWSTDALLTGALELEQSILPKCKKAGFASFSRVLQAAYLAKLGWPHATSDLSLLFRGFIASEKDRGRLVPRVSQAAKTYTNASALKVLSNIYKEVSLVEGVLIVGANPSQTSVLRTLVKKACARHEKTVCPFWSSTYLTRVAVVSQSGIAAYVPQTGVLQLSAEILVPEYTSLGQVVLFHELAHVAQHRHEALTAEKWPEAFGVFSGWSQAQGKWQTPVRFLKAQWNDLLQKESTGSPYSLLPDAPSLAMDIDGKAVDGFVFEKSARETIRAGDVSEDMADHIAAFLVAPERFCFQEKPVAPQKYRWVAENVFQQDRKLVCKKLN